MGIDKGSTIFKGLPISDWLRIVDVGFIGDRTHWRILYRIDPDKIRIM